MEEEKNFSKKKFAKSRIIKFSICHTEAIRKLPQSDVSHKLFF